METEETFNTDTPDVTVTVETTDEPSEETSSDEPSVVVVESGSDAVTGDVLAEVLAWRSSVDTKLAEHDAAIAAATSAAYEAQADASVAEAVASSIADEIEQVEEVVSEEATPEPEHHDEPDPDERPKNEHWLYRSRKGKR